MFNALMSGNISKSQADDNKFKIRGYMSVPIVDLENEVIGTEAYDDAIRTVDERVKKGFPIPMFVEHRRKELSLPIGKVVKAGKDENGMWFEGEIAGGILGTPIRELIAGGYLSGCSIGGDAVKKTRYFDTKVNKDVTKITKMQLRELSLTGLPVNEESVFALAKSQNKDKKEVRGLMKSLDSAIDTQKMILSLEKAVEPDNLDEDSLNRIKEALNNLAKLLKIDNGMSGNSDTTMAEGTLEGQQNVETPPTQEEEVANESENIDTSNEEMPQPEMQNKDDENVGLDPNIQAKLDEMSNKLDKLLGNESNENENDEIEEEISLEDDVEESNESEESEEPDKSKGKIKERNKKETTKSQNYERGENMEILECEKCGDQFEKSDNYEANYCPHCGGKVIDKSVKEENKEVEKEEELECEHCKSIFVKSTDYEASYCPKCGKSLNSFSVAVAKEPEGAKTAYKAEKKMPKGSEDAGSIAVAKEPEGAKTAYEANEGKETGNNVKQFGDNDYIDANSKEVADKKGSDLNESRPSGKKLLTSFNSQEVSTYGKDRLGKSLEERLEKLEKSLDTSKGRRTIVESESGLNETKIEKSVPTQRDLDKVFINAIFKK